MPSWQAIAVFCFALATTACFKLLLPDPERGGSRFDETEPRLARLKRYRMEHGTCVDCGEPLGRIAGTPASSLCARCGARPHDRPGN